MNNFKRHLFFATFLVFLSQSVSLSQSQPVTWVSNDLGELYLVDLNTCQSQLIGVSTPIMKDLAYNPVDGLLYGLFSGWIYTIDIQNANAVYIDAITPLPWSNFFTSMTCDENGVLYIITTAGFVYTYNTITSTQSYLGTLPSFGGAAGDCSFYNGELVLTSVSDELVTVDLTDLSSSYVNGTYNGISTVYGVVSYTDCDTDSSVLLAMPDNDIYNVSYWTLNTSLLCDNIVPGIIYGAATTSETSCDTSCIYTVTPVFDLDSIICEGDAMLNFPTASVNGIDGNWVPPLDVMNTTTYQFLPNSGYCADTISHELVVLPSQPALISGEQLLADTITSTVFSGTPSNGIWSANCTGCIDSTTGEFYPSLVGEGEYEICFTPISNAPCLEIACITVIVFKPNVLNFIKAPNVFTPNSDPQNNVFQFTNYSTSLTEFHCEIVNRWGQTIAELNSIYEVWDGTDPRGNLVAEGTYFCRYEASFQNGEIINGQGIVQLIRN